MIPLRKVYNNRKIGFFGSDKGAYENIINSTAAAKMIHLHRIL